MIDFAQQLPALIVVIPLLAAPIAVILNNRKLVYGFTCLIMAINFFIALALTSQVMQNGVISYYFGGWLPPIGIEFRIDALAAVVVTFVSLITFMAMPWMYHSVAKDIEAKRQYLFYTMLLLCYAGLLGMVVTGDAFNLFVFLEISSIATYVLIGMSRDRRGTIAAFNYLIMGTIGATFYIISVGMMYQATGTLNMIDMAARLAQLENNKTVIIALAFMFTGLGLKAAIFPLHSWLPRSYTFAPDAASTFLASTATKVSLYALLRISSIMFITVAPQLVHMYDRIFVILGIAAMIAGAAAATRQYNIKRILAFSSVSQIGYMIMAIGLSRPESGDIATAGFFAAIFHMFSHALLKGLLFMGSGALAYRGLGPWLVRLQGRGRDMPITMGLFIIGGLGLIGVPGTIGFISKWYLVRAAVLNGNWIAVAAILITSALAVIYFWRLIEVAYLMKPPAHIPKAKEAPLSMLIPMAITAAMIIGFGFYNKPIVNIIKHAPDHILIEHSPIEIPLVPLTASHDDEGAH
ncbi:MAG: monovalent cation/H+ antiporter subunit D family protein [Alphaproteobacteria bacterium]